MGAVTLTFKPLDGSLWSSFGLSTQNLVLDIRDQGQIMFLRLALEQRLPFLDNFLKQQQTKTGPILSPNANLNSRILKSINPKRP